jgi:hypothetical protein
VFLQWNSASFSLENPPFTFQFPGGVLVAPQWKSALLFPLRQRIVVAMEARHDELGSSAAHPTELLLLSFSLFLSRSDCWFYFVWVLPFQSRIDDLSFSFSLSLSFVPSVEYNHSSGFPYWWFCSPFVSVFFFSFDGLRRIRFFFFWISTVRVYLHCLVQLLTLFFFNCHLFFCR